MSTRKTATGVVLGDNGKPILKVDGTEATLTVPEPIPQAVIGGVISIREDEGEPTHRVNIYVRRGGTPLVYRQAYLSANTAGLGGLPACSKCDVEVRSAGSLFVPTLKESGKLSPDDERFCSKCYPPVEQSPG